MTEISPKRAKTWLGALILLLAMAGLIGAGWGLASAFQSPEQRDAQAQAPRPSAIYVTVERGRLEDSASGSGTIRHGASQTLSPTELPENAVVTRSTVAVNSTAVNGTVITELNGRPVVALTGAFAFYRDLSVRDTGPDVEQFQTALREAGFAVEVDGHFGSATLRATRLFYESRGYDLIGKSVPLTEVIAVRHLPATVTSSLAVGDRPDPDEGIAQVGTGELNAVVQVDGAVGARLERTTRTTLAIDSKARMVPGTILRIRDRKDGFTEVVISARRPLPPGSSRSPVVARFSFDQVARDALLVPSRAVTSDSKNRTWVLVREGDTDRKIAVTVLGDLAGSSAISLDGELRDGDQVRVD